MKTRTLTEMKDFRLISLCTISYKCIAKILVAQSDFVLGRNISGNILMAQKLFRGYTRDTCAKLAFKVDLHKAFDSLSWEFIMAALT